MRILPFGALLGGLLGAACDVEAPSEGDPVVDLRVLAWRAGTTTQGGMEVVKTTSAIEIEFDRFLLPPDANRQAICLRSSNTPVERADQCTESVGTLSPVYDPVRRTLTYFLQEKLAPSTTYQLTIFRGTSIVFGVRAFDGATLAKNVEVTFRTSDGVGETEVEKPAYDVPFCATATPHPVVAQCEIDCAGAGGGAPTDCACAPSEILGKHCASCHGSSDPPMGLSFSDIVNPATKVTLLDETAMGKVAHQTQVGGRGDVGTEQPQRFGVAMPIIARGQPGNSYLIYKLLANGLSEASADEHARLRESVVVGMPMPPDNAATVHPAQVRVLSEWILSGAPVEPCN